MKSFIELFGNYSLYTTNLLHPSTVRIPYLKEEEIELFIACLCMLWGECGPTLNRGVLFCQKVKDNRPLLRRETFDDGIMPCGLHYNELLKVLPIEITPIKDFYPIS